MEGWEEGFGGGFSVNTPAGESGAGKGPESDPKGNWLGRLVNREWKGLKLPLLILMGSWVAAAVILFSAKNYLIATGRELWPLYFIGGALIFCGWLTWVGQRHREKAAIK
ncbi:MAG TPA: hypothetical protein VIJ29_04735 [Candidatus Paceibacterota bacterium]